MWKWLRKYVLTRGNAMVRFNNNLNTDFVLLNKTNPLEMNYCSDCKTCDQCHDPADEEKMLFCDYCDRGYHIYCVGLRKIPEGRWHCPACARCGSCGTQDPSGTEGNKQWIHEVRSLIQMKNANILLTHSK